MELAHLTSFEKFDVLEFSSKNQHTLGTLTIAVLERFGIFEKLRIRTEPLRAYLLKIEANYKPNAYHNALHAADVVQTVACLLDAGLKDCLTPLETFSIILAAAVHDVAHPGVNNDFHVRTRSRVAEEYNNLSPNENMHAKCAVDAALEPDSDFMGGLTDAQVEQVHKIMRSVILSTDMKYHMDFLSRFSSYLDEHGTNFREFDDEGRLIVMQMALKIADIINPARRIELAVEWGRRVMVEMFRQGDLESDLGLEVTPICNKLKNKPSSAQLFFIDKVLRPSLVQWGRINKLGAHCLEAIKLTEEFWKANGNEEDEVILKRCGS